MKKKLKRLLAVLISFAVMAVSLPWLPATEASAADAASVPLKSLKAGDTVNFGPESSPLTWIVLNPSTGLLLLQSTYGGAHVTYDGHGNSEFNPNSIYNIGYFLNSDKQSDYYDVNEQGWGPVLEISSIPLQSHDWEYLTGYKVNCKVGLLSYDEYQKYRNIPGVVLNGRDWWLLSMAQGFGGMWMVQSNGDTKAVNPDKTFNGMEPNVRPAIYLDPNIPVTGGAGGTISKLMPTAPGFNTAPAAKQGSAALTTAITANCNTTGDKLVVSTSSSTLAAPKYLDPPPTGSNVINPYTSGSDIIRTSSGQYVGVYELNPCGNVVAFSQIQLTADDIKPVGNNERVALKNLKAGTTTVHFVGYDWILLNPATGFLMKKTPYSQQVFRRNDPKMTLEQARFNPADKENIACYLNGTDYDTGIFTGTGFYEHLTQTYPNSVGYIQYHPWQIKFYNMQVLNPRSGEQFQDPKTENCKIGLLNKDECMANAYLIRPVSCASFWWLIDYAITEKWVKTGKDDSLVSIDGAFVADELGREGPQALDNSLSVFPAIYIGPDSPVYVAQNNLVLAANDLPFTITAVQGSTVGTATVSVSPVSPAIRYYVSHSKIEFPERNESLPAGAVTSGVNLSAVPGDYVGVYCVNDNNQIMSFNQIQMTAAMCSPAVPTFSPNGGGPYTSGQTVTLGNIASGNTAYYTTDGSDPMTSSTKIQYTAPFLFSHNGTVTARTYNSEGGWSKMVSAAFTFLYNSAVSPASATFDLNTAKAADIPVTVSLNDNTMTDIKNGTDTLEKGKDYTVSDSGGKVTILKSYLSGLIPTSYTLTFDFDKGNAAKMSLTVVNTAVSDSTVSTDVLYADKNPNGGVYVDAPFKVNLNGNTLVNIRYGGTTLEKGKDYTVSDSGSTVTIPKESLSKFQIGQQILTFDFNAGCNSPSVNVMLNVIDTDTAPSTQCYKLFIDANGNRYMMCNNMILEVPAKTGTQRGKYMEAGKPYVVVGTGILGSIVDGTSAAKTKITVDYNDSPTANIAADAAGNLYFTDRSSQAIREVPAADSTQWGVPMRTGNVYTLPNKARIFTADADGNLYTAFTEGYNGKICMTAVKDETRFGICMKAGNVYTLIGLDGNADNSINGIPVNTAYIYKCSDMHVDASGNFYYADDESKIVEELANQDGIQRGTAMKAGYLYTVVGSGSDDKSDKPRIATKSEFYPNWVTTDAAGNLYFGSTYGSVCMVAASDGIQRGVYMKQGYAYRISPMSGNRLAVDSSKTIYDSYCISLNWESRMTTFPDDVPMSATAFPVELYGQKLTVYDIHSTNLYASVEHSTAGLTASDITVNDGAKLTFYGTDSTFKTPAAGGVILSDGTDGKAVTTKVYFSVTSPDKTRTVQYTLNVTRNTSGNANLATVLGHKIAVTGTADDFYGSITVHLAAIHVPYSTAAVSINDLVPEDSSAYYLHLINDNWQNLSKVSLTAGSGTVIYVKVMAQNRDTNLYYKVTVYRDGPISVGSQNGALTAGTAGSATFAAAASDGTTVSDGSATVNWCDASGTATTAPAGLTPSAANFASNKSTVTITADKNAKAGTYYFKITSGDKTSGVTEVKVTAPVTLESIAITKPATKTVYTVGDKLDLSGLEVTGTYSDKSTKVETVTAGNVSGFDSTKAVASQTLTVKVGEKTATYTVEIKAAPVTLESIAITKPATKTVYTVGDKLDLTGLEVTGTYSDNSTKVETVTAGNVSGFDSSAPAASQTLTVKVGEKTASYTVEIKAAPVTLESIAITKPATKTVYTVGDKLDLTGLEVTGTYSDKSTKVETVTKDN
ncbi:MAG TPA: X2-like carbohydrate binding domain-containing protein, partial [Caproiciproducens sp.]|nr:X2-like carbohydrate binding domain-containing protein [Caproiciproducens sp.]